MRFDPYSLIGEFAELSTALYFSVVTSTTLGVPGRDLV